MILGPQGQEQSKDWKSGSRPASSAAARLALITPPCLSQTTIVSPAWSKMDPATRSDCSAASVVLRSARSVRTATTSRSSPSSSGCSDRESGGLPACHARGPPRGPPPGGRARGGHRTATFVGCDAIAQVATDEALGSADQEAARGLVGVDDEAVAAEGDGALSHGLEEDAVHTVRALEREELFLAGAGGHHECVDAAAANGVERLLGLLEPRGELLDLEEVLLSGRSLRRLTPTESRR